jgi:hypothetical protein
VLSASLPSVGAGALKNREDPKILGTAKVCFVSLTVCHSDTYSIPGIGLVAGSFTVLQDFCHRLFSYSGFCGHVLVQRCLSGRRYSW